MNIEEAINILKDNIESLERPKPFKHTNNEKVQAIETLLTAYEKEKEKNEELKNADLTTVYLNGVYDGEKKVQDKIKSKIDYLLKHYDSENFMNFEMFIMILQSLLEKE